MNNHAKTIPFFFIAIVGAAQSFAQQPPGSESFQIDYPGYHSLITLNDVRQIAFQSYFLTSQDRYITVWNNGVLTDLAGPPDTHGKPFANNNNDLIWDRGNPQIPFIYIYKHYTDFTYDTIYTNYDYLPHYYDGLLSWCRRPASPVSNASREINIMTGNANDLMSYDSPWWYAMPPRVNSAGTTVFFQVNLLWGLLDTPHRIRVEYSDGTSTTLGSDAHVFSQPVRINDHGIIMFDDGLTYDRGITQWDGHEFKKVIPFGSLSEINNRGDILFFTGEFFDIIWLYRNGAFYQPFAGKPHITNGYMNNRGDVVAGGHLLFDIPQDVYVNFINLIPTDHNEDGDVDTGDVAGFAACATGPLSTPATFDYQCIMMDADTNGAIDLADVATYQNTFTGNCALRILTPPYDLSICWGNTKTITIDVDGPVATYQWIKNGQDIPGANGPSITVGAQDAGLYGIRLTSTCGWEVVSDWRHNVEETTGLPAFTSGPPTVEVACPGKDTKWSFNVFEWDFQHYVWTKNGVPLPDNDFPYLFLRNVSDADAGEYRVTATNDCGSTTSYPVELIVQPSTTAPTIAMQPIPWTSVLNNTSALRVLAWCADSYQWTKNGQLVPGATGPELIIHNTQCSDQGQYRARVSNANGSVLTNQVELKVLGCNGPEPDPQPTP